MSSLLHDLTRRQHSPTRSKSKAVLTSVSILLRGELIVADMVMGGESMARCEVDGKLGQQTRWR